MKWLADENFPFPSFRYLLDRGLDIIHAGSSFPSIADERVVEIAREENRILLTFDRDFGKLIFSKKVIPPPAVVFFRILDYTPDNAGKLLYELLADGFDPTGFFTVVRVALNGDLYDRQAQCKHRPRRHDSRGAEDH